MTKTKEQLVRAQEGLEEALSALRATYEDEQGLAAFLGMTASLQTYIEQIGHMVDRLAEFERIARAVGHD